MPFQDKCFWCVKIMAWDNVSITSNITRYIYIIWYSIILHSFLIYSSDSFTVNSFRKCHYGMFWLNCKYISKMHLHVEYIVHINEVIAKKEFINIPSSINDISAFFVCPLLRKPFGIYTNAQYVKDFFQDKQPVRPMRESSVASLRDVPIHELQHEWTPAMIYKCGWDAQITEIHDGILQKKNPETFYDFGISLCAQNWRRHRKQWAESTTNTTIRVPLRSVKSTKNNSSTKECKCAAPTTKVSSVCACFPVLRKDGRL